jgi:hypothetical protein
MERSNLSVRQQMCFTSRKLAVFRFNLVLGARIRKLDQPIMKFFFAGITTILSTF